MLLRNKLIIHPFIILIAFPVKGYAGGQVTSLSLVSVQLDQVEKLSKCSQPDIFLVKSPWPEAWKFVLTDFEGICKCKGTTHTKSSTEKVEWFFSENMHCGLTPPPDGSWRNDNKIKANKWMKAQGCSAPWASQHRQRRVHSNIWIEPQHLAFSSYHRQWCEGNNNQW